LEIEISEQKNNNKDLLPQIVDRIFSICKVDPSFHLKDEMEIIGNKIQSILNKIEKQDNLLKQSENLRKELLQRVEVINDNNEKKQIELLESLGSEV
jgi:Mg-chelatase subunit ChlI